MRVLLANDSSNHAQAAADYLLSLPFRKPIDLDIVCAVSPPIMIAAGNLDMPMDLGAFIAEECESARARVEQTAEKLGGPVHSVHTHVPIGPPASELLSIAERSAADLIVLGSVGHSALQRVLLGSVSDYVATHSDASTLVVRPPRESSVRPSLEKIVIALSGSPEDERMVDWLRCLKLRPSVEVHLVRILEVNKFYRQDIRLKASDFWASFVSQAQSQILALETTVQSMGLNAESHLVESDHVGVALVDYAGEHGADLIITGDSDSGLLTRIFLGSTSRYVLRHAGCSVMIVRDKQDRQTAKEQATAKAKHSPIVV